MIRYEIERDETGKPVRLWWVPPAAIPPCPCGVSTDDTNALGEPECAECRRVRIGYYFKGRDPDCRWCGGRGCLGCG
jgi:hypothetical protein